MVKILSSEELKNLSLKDLKKQAKELEEGGYPISYAEIKASPLTGDELLSYYRKKIRHAQRGKEGKSSGALATVSGALATVSGGGRRAELQKMSKRSTNHELDLLTIATSLQIPKRTILQKNELIEKILEAEASGKVATKVRPASVPKKRGRPKKVVIQEEVSESVEQPEEVIPSEPVPETVEEAVDEKVLAEQIVGTGEDAGGTTSGGASEDAGASSGGAISSSEESSDLSYQKYNYQDLLKKRLDELRKILEKKGIKDSSNVGSVRQAANMVYNLEKNKEFCSEDNDYACSDGRVCDASSNPGVCIDKNMTKNMDEIEYKGRNIVGSKQAIKALKRQLNLRSEECGPSNKYRCNDGKVCDISSNSCVGKDKIAEMVESSDDVAMMDYEGRQIIGSTSAIKNLRKRLGVPKQAKVSPSEFARNYLIERAVLVSGKPASSFSRFSEAQLYAYLEGHGIKELKNTKKSLIKQLAREQNKRKSEFSDLDLDELQRRARLIGQNKSEEEDKKYNREDMIEAIAAWTQTSPAKYVNWSNYALRQRLESLQDWENYPSKKPDASSEEEKMSKRDRKDLIEAISAWTGSSPKKYENWSNKALKQRLEALREGGEAIPAENEEVKEEKSIRPHSSSSSAEEAPAPTREKEVKRKEIEKVLSDVMAGKKDNIEEFSQAQNAVLKCLGLIA